MNSIQYKQKTEALNNLLKNLEKERIEIERNSKRSFFGFLLDNINFIIIGMFFLFATAITFRTPAVVGVQPEVDAISVSKVSTISDSQQDFEEKLKKQYANIAQVKNDDDGNIVVNSGNKEVLFFIDKSKLDNKTKENTYNVDTNSKNNSDNNTVGVDTNTTKTTKKEPKLEDVVKQQKQEAKTGSKSEIKPELKTDTKADTKSEVKSEPKQESKPDIKTDPKPEIKPIQDPVPVKSLTVTTFSPKSFVVDSVSSIVFQGKDMDNVLIKGLGCSLSKSENTSSLVRVGIINCNVTNSGYIEISNSYGKYRGNITISVPSVSETVLEQQGREYLLGLINSSRSKNGVLELGTNKNITYVAYLHSVYQLANRKLQHTSSEDLKNRLYKYGVFDVADALYVTENVGSASLASEDFETLKSRLDAIHNQMMSEVSPNDGHKRNILDSKVSRVGVFVSVGNGKVYVTENFVK